MVIESNSTDKKIKTNNYEGLEVGAVSVKWVRRTHDGEIYHKIIRHEGNPHKIIKEIFEEYKTDNFSKVVITGQAIKKFLSLPYFSEAECLEKALSYLNIKPDILISLGGETFSIYPMKNGIIKNIISSSKCAAGTGEFIVHQFQRMGLTIEDGIEASVNGNTIEMATRCSVHCKSDATHKLNKGECQRADIAKTLIYDLARKVSEMIELTQWSKNLIVVSGGVTSNEVFIENLNQLLSNSEIIVLNESPYLEAFGASLYASELSDDIDFPSFNVWFNDYKTIFETHKPLKDAEDLLDYRVKSDIKKEIIEGGTYILGVDAGSTTTKTVLYNVLDGTIGASSYLRTLGNPIVATKNCLKELIEQVGDKSIRIIQCGSTGSAREMVSVYLNNCRSFNEILAHARGATEEVHNVDTVFEIGGQDSKFISFLRGIPIDYAMNEGCSAGTGSFLEESASVDMGIDVTEISGIAEKSAHPIIFGERCAAFINTDIRDALQQGASREDVIAGLVYSIADNYISRIVGPRYLGETILFLGGVALNRAVALALAARSKRKIVVPTYPELMGSVGTALMVKDRLIGKEISEGDFSLESLIEGEMEIKGTFRCNACENNCEIQRISIRGKTYPFGGLCSKYTLQRERGENNIKEGKNVIEIRNKMMFDEWNPPTLKNPKGTIGIPMVLSAFEFFPFYSKLFNELNYKIVLSEPSKVGNKKTGAPICYPCELVHGAVYNLLNQNVDFIFLPYIMELENPIGATHSYTCTSTSSIPDIISAAFANIKPKLLSPFMGFKKSLIRITLKEIERMGVRLGITKKKAKMAGKKAMAYFYKFKEKYRELGSNILGELTKSPSVIIAGRAYITCSTSANLALPRKITSRGYNAIPLDLLPQLSNIGHERNIWASAQQIYNALLYVKKHPNTYICFMSCFSCGPDSITYHLFRKELEGKVFCYLEIDSHTAHAGFETRVGAFLDIIEERRNKAEKLNVK